MATNQAARPETVAEDVLEEMAITEISNAIRESSVFSHEQLKYGRTKVRRYEDGNAFGVRHTVYFDGSEGVDDLSDLKKQLEDETGELGGFRVHLGGAKHEGRIMLRCTVVADSYRGEHIYDLEVTREGGDSIE